MRLRFYPKDLEYVYMENFGKAMQSGAEGHTAVEAGLNEINPDGIDLGHSMEHEKKYMYGISLPVLLKQYENLKKYKAIISGDIRGNDEEDRLSKIARGRELLEEIKSELHLKSDASYEEITAEENNLYQYLASIGMVSDDGK